MSRVVTSLCSIPSFGTFGTPTYFGGPVATLGSSSPLTDDEIAALTGRATASPATITAPDLAPGWAFAIDECVWFDGFAAMYALSRHADSDKISMSFWFNPYEESSQDLMGGQSQPHGTVFCNSVGNTAFVAGADRASYFNMQYTSNPPDGSTQNILELATPGTHAGESLYPSNASANSFGLTIPGFSTDPVDEMQGWCHVMYAQHGVGGNCKATIYVNDTAILTNQTLPDNLGFAPSHDDAWTIRFSDPTFTDPNGDYGDPGAMSAPWVVGGVFDLSTPPPPDTLPKGDREGQGLIGAVTEMWIAPGQYIDWSDAANRKKFHNVDLTETLYVPVNLGPKGATPTGTKPQYYFTGGPDKFPINRATGSSGRVWHRGAPFGVVDRLRDYGVVPGT